MINDTFVSYDDGGAPAGGEGDGGQGGTTEPSAEEVKAARKQAIEKLGLEFARGSAGTQQPAAGQGGETSDLEVDLTGVDPEVAKQIKATLRNAKQLQDHVSTLANFGMEQARKAAALEIAQEFGMDADERKEIETALNAARNPDGLDLTRRELVIKLREDGTFSKPASKKVAGVEGKKPDEKPRTFDQGRGTGGNQAAALRQKIAEIDYSKPGAVEELAKLKGEVDAAQARFQERYTRRSS